MVLFTSIYYWQNLRYHASFAIVFALNFLILSIILMGVGLLLKIIVFSMKRYCARSKRNRTESEDAEVLLEREEAVSPELEHKRRGKWFASKGILTLALVIDILGSLFILATIFFLSLLPAVFYGLHLIPLFVALLATSSFYAVCMLILIAWMALKRKEKLDDAEERPSNDTFKAKSKMVVMRHKNLFLSLGLIGTILTILLPLGLRDTCLCIFTKKYGISVLSGDAVLTSRMLRSFIFDKVCPPGPPCHVYATLPSDASSSVFINVHTDYDVQGISVAYDSLSNYTETGKLQYSAASSSYSLDFEDLGRRTVHTVLLYGLVPETDYYYHVVYNGESYNGSVYRTLPKNGTQSNMTIGIGGDVGSNDIAEGVTASLSSRDPDVLIVGGDAAYDDGLQACWYSWDLYLEGFEKYNALRNRTVPFIVSVGNHDVGFNAMSNATLNQNELPLYFYFLPQHYRFDPTTGLELMEVPSPHERRTYFYHLIGNTMQVSLDSGYVATYPFQAKWMEDILPQFESYAKFGNYHVPIYPTCSSTVDNPITHIEVAAQNFVPAFEKHGFKALFENHVHLFKKTYPIKQGVYDPNGIVYYGDGNWGITPSNCISLGFLANDTGIIEVVNNTRHVWIVELNTTNFEIYPVDIDGKQFYPSSYGNMSVNAI